MLAGGIIILIRIYRATVSRLLCALFGRVCRFEPSCSQYAMECLRTHGTLRGGLLSLLRLCKCHPFHPGGIDLPPHPTATGRKVPGVAKVLATGPVTMREVG